MLARLNTLLLGCTGVQPAIVQQYADFLNLHIHPRLPLRGSIGAADITLLAHIGLAFIGEGEVELAGRPMPALTALEQAGWRRSFLVPRMDWQLSAQMRYPQELQRWHSMNVQSCWSLQISSIPFRWKRFVAMSARSIRQFS